MHSVGCGELRVKLDAAGAIGGVLGELDVAIVTPGGVPRVLHEPVILAIFGAVTNDQHSVVKIIAAFGARKDATTVGLEDHLVGLDGDGKRRGLEGSQHLGWVGWSNVLE